MAESPMKFKSSCCGLIIVDHWWIQGVNPVVAPQFGHAPIQSDSLAINFEFDIRPTVSG